MAAARRLKRAPGEDLAWYDLTEYMAKNATGRGYSFVNAGHLLIVAS